jgi:hypothetical protein
MIHVYPINDEKEHELEGTQCWCEPVLDVSNFGELIVIHNSADGRELIEQAEEIKDEIS